MINVEYVVSACGMGIIPHVDFSDYSRPILHKTLNELSKILQKRIKEDCSHYEPSISGLFNAYTEEKFLERFKFFDNLFMKGLYADSGGLQMITLKKTITEEIKQKIYEVQSYSDYAMCFDVIALQNHSKKDRTRNERSNVGNKIFKQGNHKEAAIATGKNIKAQIEAFKRFEAKTKVIIIVQGNDKDDMYDFYTNIIDQLDNSDYNHIGGLAIADTCIGNGELESVEMLRAARKINSECHENIRNHLHILGVGSVPRMRPVINLVRSTYLPTYNCISFDSSSHTSCFDYGLLKVYGTCRRLGSYHTIEAQEHFVKVYNMFGEFYRQWVTLDEFLEIIFGTEKGDWKYSTIKKRGLASGSEIKASISYFAKAAHTFYQIHNFMTCVNDLWKEKFSGSPMSNLLYIKDEYDMIKWIENSHFKRRLKSRRIKREEDTSVEALWS